MPNCGYCLGERCPCECLEDCGARATDLDSDPVWCPRAPGYVDYLARTGLYRPDELETLRDQGYR